MTPNGVVMAPTQLQKWLVLVCDKINLPALDKYGKEFLFYNKISDCKYTLDRCHSLF